MWMTILSFIGGPVVSGLIKAYQAKLTAQNTSETTAADLAAAESALDLERARMSNSICGVTKNGVKFKVRERKR